uniref:MFS transporter n=1 Tax=uncultured Megasphaera sp. TaxID=165188 RepID=UPI00265963EA
MLWKKQSTFISAFCSLAAVYGASSAPIPLYSLYKGELSLTNAALSLSAVLYFAGALAALLVLARLSDYCGRKPLTLSTLIMSAIGCVLFYSLQTEWMFLLARLVQGLSCGLGASCIAAWLVDTGGSKLGAIASSSAPMAGLAAGSFGSGLLVQYGRGAGDMYVILLALIAVCALCTAFSTETVISAPGALRSLRPAVRLPRAIRPYLPAAGAVFVGTWAVGGFYQAFAAPLAAEQLQTNSTLVAAAVFACLQAPNMLGSTLSGRMTPEKAQLWGISAFFLSMGGIVLALWFHGVVPFLCVTALAGIAWGLGYTGSVQILMRHITAADRAGVLSAICLISYSGAALPNLVVSRIASGWSLLAIAAAYTLVVGAAWLITAVCVWKQMARH